MDPPFLVAYEQKLQQQITALSAQLQQLRDIYLSECTNTSIQPRFSASQYTDAEWKFLAQEVGLPINELKTRVEQNELKGQMLRTYRRLTTEGIRISEEKRPSEDEIESTIEQTGLTRAQLRDQKYHLTLSQYVQLTQQREQELEELKAQRLAARGRLQQIEKSEKNRPSAESEHKKALQTKIESNDAQRDEFELNIEAIQNDWTEIEQLVDELVDDNDLVSEKDKKESIDLINKGVKKWIDRYEDYLWLTRLPENTTISETRYNIDKQQDEIVTLTFDPVQYDIRLAKMNDALDKLKSRLEEAKESGQVDELEGSFSLAALLDEALTEELHEV